jgi:protein ImuB
VLKPDTLARALDRLPVGLLPAAQSLDGALEQIGCVTLGDLRHLPRGGIARRFGAQVLTQLEQAYGEAPDPRDIFVAPAAFDARLELMARVDSADALLFAARRLIAQLCGWLAARRAALTGFDLLLMHEPAFRGAPKTSRIAIAWAEPSCDAEHLTWLLRERLNQIELASPVLELSLHATHVVEHEAPSGTLFPLPGAERDSVIRLVERLSARLGDERVLELALAEDHRPEAAVVSRPWRVAALERRAGAGRRGKGNLGRSGKGSSAAGMAGTMSRKAATASRPYAKHPSTRLPASMPVNALAAHLHAASAAAGKNFIAPFRTPFKAPTTVFGTNSPLTPNTLPRPGWLLNTPQALIERHGAPFYRTTLTLVAGPERVEAGWWDGQGVARDYYIAADARSHWYWLFRERATGDWFLHGFFG